MPESDISDVDFLRQMILSPDPIVTSKELVQQFGLTQQAVYSRLRKLEAEDYVDSKKVGSRARVWWVTEAGVDRVNQ